MRQAGVLAAAGIVALNEMVERLSEDHEHARELAQGLATIRGIRLKSDQVTTNIVFFGLTEEVKLDSSDIAAMLQSDYGVWLGTDGPRGFRALTHYWVGLPEVRKLLEGLRCILEQESPLRSQGQGG
jgi:threonine aldolase